MEETLQAILQALQALQAHMISAGSDVTPSQRLDNQVVDSVSASNFKCLGDAPAFAMGTMFQNAVSHAKRIDTIAEAQLGVISNKLLNVDPMGAKAVSELYTAPASLLSALGSAIAQIQQVTKGAQSTPPETGGG